MCIIDSASLMPVKRLLMNIQLQSCENKTTYSEFVFFSLLPPHWISTMMINASVITVNATAPSINMFFLVCLKRTSISSERLKKERLTHSQQNSQASAISVEKH